MIKILLVDDDDRYRNQLQGFLIDEGYQVRSCTNGQIALSVLQQESYDLLLSNIRIPGLSGLELARQVQQLGLNKTHTVLFTAFSDQKMIIEALRYRVYDFLIKPIDLRELKDIVQRVADHKLIQAGKVQDNHKSQPVLLPLLNPAPSSWEKENPPLTRITEIGHVGLFSEAMQQIVAKAARLHQDRSVPVLIEGETGTGKEIIARHIHYGEDPHSGPFIPLNCAALSPTVFESELFGYEAGTFTGGLKRGKPGKLDLANGGTLFLDEISELPLELQAKLLRLIQEREYYRVGGLNIVKSNVRFVCATNRDIEELVAQKKFRDDLYYRLAVGRITIPPLRQRPEAILPLAEAFLSQIAAQKGKQYSGFSPQAADLLLKYHWPGNIRELRNEIERLVLFQDEPLIQPEHLTIPSQVVHPGPVQEADATASLEIGKLILPPYSLPLDELNNEILIKALRMHQGNKTRTAKYLGISRSALLYRLGKLERPPAD